MTRRDQRNFFPALALTLLWWILLAILVLRIDPEVVANFPFTGTYGLFFGLLFLAVWFLASLIFVNSRRGFLLALAIVVFGYLRLVGLGSLINALLLVGFFLALEVYQNSKKLTKTPSSRTNQDNETQTPE